MIQRQESIDEVLRQLHDHFEAVNLDDFTGDDSPWNMDVPQYIIILRAILRDVNHTEATRSIIRLNQKRILSRIVNDPSLLSLTSKMKPFKNEAKEMSIQTYQSFTFLREFIMLLAYLAKDSKLGTLQVKRVMSYELVKEVLRNTDTLFWVKKAYLRFFFHVATYWDCFDPFVGVHRQN
jgi:hypothetical protein